MIFRIFFFFLIIQFSGLAQTGFEFNGQVNSRFISSIVYLNKIEDLNKKDRFFTENIILESKIDSMGRFSIKGDFLPEENAIYKIYIDNCSENIAHTNHILDRCQNNVSVLFIANNSSRISFPLNDLNQIFCELHTQNGIHSIIQKIDSFQNNILQGLNSAKNDRQRQIVYKQSFIRLQQFSKQFNEPLAELYAFYLYSENESYNRSYFIEDIQTSEYYNQLKEKLHNRYPNSVYLKQYKRDLNLFSPKLKTNESSSILIPVLILLISSILLNIYFYFFKIQKLNTPEQSEQNPNYKDILTKQEQKVFELMHSGLTNKAIAQTLFVSLSTIKSHINSIYTKLNISSRKDIEPFFECEVK